jgi:hypothetical protein
MQAAFYGVGAAVIGIIALAAGQLAQLALRRDRLQRGIFAVIAAVTGWTESDNGLLFLLCAACCPHSVGGRRRRTCPSGLWSSWLSSSGSS